MCKHRTENYGSFLDSRVAYIVRLVGEMAIVSLLIIDILVVFKFIVMLQGDRNEITTV